MRPLAERGWREKRVALIGKAGERSEKPVRI
jgi:hypothetical protein